MTCISIATNSWDLDSCIVIHTPHIALGRAVTVGTWRSDVDLFWKPYSVTPFNLSCPFESGYMALASSIAQ